jgi:peptidoglycan/xylan/chitin deacetylase (PgdA/CDA1 family)
MGATRSSLVAIMVASLLLSGCFGTASSPSPDPTSTGVPSATPSPGETASVTPGETASPSERPTPESTPSPAPTVPPTAQPFISYSVAAGDGLGTIAARYDTTWQSLVYWNRDAHPSLDPANQAYDPNRLEIGWILRIQPGVVVPFDAPLPATPTPAPTRAPTPAPTSAPVTGSLVTNGSRSTNRVALTLDMGGRVEPALAIMTWLRDHNVRATIFMTGSMADSTNTDVGRQVLERIDARPDLFDLGNHSYSHPDMTTLSTSQMIDELRRAEAAIDRYASMSPRPFFRPPFGAWNNTLVNAAASAGYPFTVMWDIDTIDWKPIADGGPTAQQIVDKVVSRAQGGSIVLMHLGGYETLDALPGIVDGLRARGFEFVTLDTMLGG